MADEENIITEEVIDKVVYLPDRPIAGVEDDRLGHSSVAKTLKNAIDKWDGESPFTAGLFGGWGTGKSGVGQMLTRLIKETKDDSIAIVEFDVWRYEKDSFRRQFLVFLDSDKGLDTKLPKVKELYVSTVNENEVEQHAGKSFLERLGIFGQGIIIAIFIAIAAGLFYLAQIFTAKEAIATILKTFGTVSLTAAIILFIAAGAINKLFSLLIKYLEEDLNDLFKKRKQFIVNHQITYPEKFTEIFDDIIKTASKKKIVIILDNLDRVQDDKILELLSSIKTYLEHKNVAFVVQCDDGAIKRHLEHLYHRDSTDKDRFKEGQQYTEEFLRKFFNTYVRIPPFLSVDLDKFTKGLLLKTNLPFATDEVVATIASSHRENPRKIKQFINALVSRFLLAYHRETKDPGTGEADLQPNAVTGNPAMLTKTLVFEQEYPHFFKLLRERPYLWNLVDAYVRTERLPQDPREKDEITSIVADGGRDSGELGVFLRATKVITTNDISPFIFLKQSYASQGVGADSNELRVALEDDNRASVQQLLETSSAEKMNDYEDYILEILENSTNEIRVFNIVNSLLASKKVFGKRFYNSVAAYVAGDRKERLYPLEGFEVSLIFNSLLPNIDDTFRQQLLSRYAKLFKRITDDKLDTNIDVAEYRTALVKEIAEHAGLFNQEDITTISAKLREDVVLNSNPDLIEPLYASEEALKRLIRAPHLRMLVDSISTAEGNSLLGDKKSSSLLKKIDLILKAKVHVNEDVGRSLFFKLRDLLGDSNLSANEKIFASLNGILKDVLKSLGSKVLEANGIVEIGNILKTAYDRVGEPEKVIPGISMILLRDSAINELGEDIQPLAQYVEELFNNLSTPALKDVLGSLQILNKEGVPYEGYRASLERRAMSQLDIFNLLATDYNALHKEEFLARFIKDSSLFVHGLEKLDELKSIKNKDLMANCVLSRARRESFATNIEIVSRLAKIDFADETFKGVLVDFLAELLRTHNDDYQNQTCIVINQHLKKYLGETGLLKLTDSLIDNPTASLGDINQYIGMLSCISSLPLSDAGRKKLSDALIGRVLIPNIEDTRIINHILPWLKEASITYTNAEAQYENLYNRLISASQTIKQHVGTLVLEYGLADGNTQKAKDFKLRIKNLAGQ